MVNEVELFRPQNVPLETEEEVLQQQYQKICGTMTVTYRETEYTLQQLAPFLLENDRAVRQEVWELPPAAASRTATPSKTSSTNSFNFGTGWPKTPASITM